MDKIKLIKEIEHIALTYEFDEVVKDCTYEEFIEDWGKDVYECIYIDYIYGKLSICHYPCTFLKFTRFSKVRIS